MFYFTEHSKGSVDVREPSRSHRSCPRGNASLGKEIVKTLAAKGATVYLSGRTQESASAAAQEIGQGTIGLAVDLSMPETIAGALSSVPSVDDLVIAAIERDANTLANYDVAAAVRLVTLKLVGYTEAVHALRDRLTPQASIVLFGGLALLRPTPDPPPCRRSMVASSYRQFADDRTGTDSCQCNSSRHHWRQPFWEGKDNSNVINRTPLGRLVTMAEIVDSVEFLLNNTGVNGVNLAVDGAGY